MAAITQRIADIARRHKIAARSGALELAAILIGHLPEEFRRCQAFDDARFPSG